MLLAVNIRSITGVVVFIAALFFAVMFHEFGHYVFARRAGMKVSEFFFGFGKRIWSTTRTYVVLYDIETGREVRTIRLKDATDPDEFEDKTQDELIELAGKKGRDKSLGAYVTTTEFGIKAIPAGGYVKIAGMDPYEETPDRDRGHTYADKSYGARAMAILAGPMANILVAFLLLWVLAVAGELPGQARAIPVVGEVSPPAGCLTTEGVSDLDGKSCAEATPAQVAGLMQGDRFIAIDGTSIKSWDQVKQIIGDSPGRTLVFTVERSGGQLDLPVTVGERPPFAGETGQQPFVGVIVSTAKQGDNPAVATVTAGKAMASMTAVAFYSVYKFFTPENLKRYIGLMGGESDPEANNARFVSPVGVARLSAQAAQQGWAILMMIMVIFNLFLGIFNLVPLLPLDGGHLLVVGYEKVASMIMRRKVRVNLKRLVPVMAAVIILFVLIGASSLYLDIVNPIADPFR